MKGEDPQGELNRGEREEEKCQEDMDILSSLIMRGWIGTDK